jgi:hypothetical protein
MLRILFASAAILTASQSFAINRYHVANMTADEVRQIIQIEGRVILWYPASNPSAGDLFGVFVSNASGCGTGQSVSASSISVGGTSVNALVCTDISSSPTQPGNQGGGTAASATSSPSAGAGGAPAGGGAGGGGGGMPL